MLFDHICNSQSFSLSEFVAGYDRIIADLCCCDKNFDRRTRAQSFRLRTADIKRHSYAEQSEQQSCVANLTQHFMLIRTSSTTLPANNKQITLTNKNNNKMFEIFLFCTKQFLNWVFKLKSWMWKMLWLKLLIIVSKYYLFD